MRKIIIANYKMNPLTSSQAVKLAQAEDFSNVFIAPPAIFISDVKKVLKKASLAAQDVSLYPNSVGPATGELSATMLKKNGVRLVLIGHSERRALGESNAKIFQKIESALAADLKVVVCVGEPLSVRQKGVSAVKKFLEKQLVETSRLKNNNLLIAYEPIWAIGTGRFCEPVQAAEIASYLKSILDCLVLYGGSVSVQNAPEFLAERAIDGLLVGGLSLQPKEFRKIIT